MEPNHPFSINALWQVIQVLAHWLGRALANPNSIWPVGLWLFPRIRPSSQS